MPLLFDVIALLKQDGWNLNPEKTADLLSKKLSASNTSQNEVVSLLLNEEIKDFAHPKLQDQLDKKSSMLTGPIVVQLARWKNVSYPKIADHLGNDGLCKLSLTDGFSTLEGLQLDQPLDSINGNTPAGSKIMLRDKLLYEGGYLILNPTNCFLLGGHVEKLVEKWLATKLSIKKNGSTITADYPKFEPFQKKKNDYKPTIEANISSLTLNSCTQNVVREENQPYKEKIVQKKKIPKPIRSEINSTHPTEYVQPSEFTNQTSSSHQSRGKRQGVSRGSMHNEQGPAASSRGRGPNKHSNRGDRLVGSQNFSNDHASSVIYDQQDLNYQEGYGINFGRKSARSDLSFGNSAGRSNVPFKGIFYNRANQRPGTMFVYGTHSQEELPALEGKSIPSSRAIPSLFDGTPKTFYRSKRN